MSEETAVERRCFKCGRAVAEEDLSSGRAYVRDDYYVCPECLETIRKGAREGGVDTLKSQLAAMTAEMRNISQHLHYEEFSWFYVLGAMLQVVVFFILYRSYQSVDAAGTTNALLTGVVVQLMTITAFIIGKLR